MLLLLLPSVATALAAPARENSQAALQKNPELRSAKLEPLPTPIVDLNTKSKHEVGTKDAPVDGKDGKPHAGPWVGSEKDPKRAKSKDEEAVLSKDSKTELVTPDGEKIPSVNDGVMDDPTREKPKYGTTGTEGGVSEKDKARKAQEGQTGERVEKKPDSPKEAPHDEQAKKEKSNHEKNKGKSSDEDDDATGEGLGGLEVCTPSMSHVWSNIRRNPRIFLISPLICHTHCQNLPKKTTSIP